MLRLPGLLLIAACAAIPASDAPAANPPVAIDAHQFRFRAGSAESPDMGLSGTCTKGVSLIYEEVQILGDGLAYWRSPIDAAGGEAILRRVELTPGPKGPIPERVVLDTVRSRLPQIGFRTRLEPRRLDIERRPTDVKRPGVVVYDIRLEDVRDFYGLLAGADGAWVPHVGWSDRIRLEVEADIVGAGDIANPRIRHIAMIGSGGTGGAEPRRAILRRLKRPLDQPLPAAEVPESEVVAHIAGADFDVPIDAKGRVGMILGNDIESSGQSIGEIRSRSRPQLAPATGAAPR